MANFEDVVLEDDVVRLEPLQANHLQALWPAASYESIWAVTTTRIQNVQDLEAYIAQALATKNAGTAYPFAVYYKPQQRFVGSTRFGNISVADLRAELGWTWYHPEVHGIGVNTHAKYLLLTHAFETLGLNRVEFKTDERNLRSRAAIKKIGGVQEGIFRKHMILPDGHIRNSVYFSIINDDWPSVKANLEALLGRAPKQ